MIQVTKKQFKNLAKIRETLNIVESMLRELPDELIDSFDELEDGDGLMSCVYRSAECAKAITEQVEVK